MLLLIAFGFLISYVSGLPNWQMRPLFEDDNDWRKSSHPRFVAEINVKKPLQGLSITSGDNPVYTNDIFTEIFQPGGKKDKKCKKEKGKRKGKGKGKNKGKGKKCKKEKKKKSKSKKKKKKKNKEKAQAKILEDLIKIKEMVRKATMPQSLINILEEFGGEQESGSSGGQAGSGSSGGKGGPAPKFPG